MRTSRKGGAKLKQEKIPRQGQAKIAKWPTRLGKHLAVAGENAALRDQAERNERDRWLKELRNIMIVADLPVARRTRVAGEIPLQRIAKGRRATTLRKHVKTWLKVASWLRSTFGVAWPATPDQFAEYVEAMMAGPCSRTYPVSVYKTLMFLEFAGEVDERDFIHKAASVQNVIEESKWLLEKVDLKETRKANVLLVAMVIAMEAQVCDERVREYARIYAWYKLVKLWSGMRFNDTQGVPERTMELGAFCLRGEIHRSKTTGPGKRVNIIPFYVCKEAWLSEPGWLEEGWKLWKLMTVQAGLQGPCVIHVPGTLR